MIPIAIEAGMPLDEFWYGEEELFYSYVKAYRNRVNYMSWMNNLYAMKALEVVVNNLMPNAVNIGFGGGKITPVQYYEKPIDFEAEAEKQKPVTKEDLESEFRRRMSVF